MPPGLTNSDGIPALERLMQFTGARHRVILNNIANLSTPGFRPMDVSPKEFQEQLAEALEEAGGGGNGDLIPDMGLDDDWGGGDGLSNPAQMIRSSSGSGLSLRGSKEIEVRGDQMILHPKPTGENVLFHDGRDTNVERVMQSLVENFMAFRASAQLLRSRLDSISMAIRGRI